MRIIILILIVTTAFISITNMKSHIPLAQIEGRLSIYKPLDTTSINIGHESGLMNSNITQRKNTFIGYKAGLKTTATNNGAPYSSGRSNSSFGAHAGSYNTTGSSNCLYGVESGSSNNIGYQNSFYGALSGASNKGYFSLGSLRSVYAAGNSFFGFQAGYSNESGGNNTFFGAYAGQGNVGPQTGATADEIGDGSNNTNIGYSAGRYNEDGRKDVFIGTSAGHTRGDENVIIGNETGASSVGYKNILIGYNVGPLEQGLTINIDERLYIDIEQPSDPLLYGEFDNDLIRINGDLEAEGYIKVKGSGTLATPSCQFTSHHGRMYYDTTRNRMRVCTLLTGIDRPGTGWKDTHDNTTN